MGSVNQNPSNLAGIRTFPVHSSETVDHLAGGGEIRGSVIHLADHPSLFYNAE